MSNILPNVFKVSKGAQNKSKFNLNQTHITTTDFGYLRPVQINEVVPSDHFNINSSAFVRLAPMAFPTYGKLRLKQTTFFVPSRIISPHVQPFFEDKSTFYHGDKYVTTSIPSFTIYDLICALTHDAYGSIYELAEFVFNNNDPYDFIYQNQHYKLTPFGKHCISVFHSLGYEFDLNSADQNIEFSLLPLLAYLRIIYDYYVFPSADSQALVQFDILFNSDSVKLFTSASQQRTNVFWLCMYLSYAFYDSDYFTAAWENTDSPLYNNVPSISITDSRLGWNEQISNVSRGNSTGLGTRISIDSLNLSSYALRVLNALDKWSRRNSFVGKRLIDKIYADFGIKVDDLQMQRCEYLGSTITPIQISDVNATASTDLASLGDYTGKGVGFENGHLCSYDVDEYGFIITLATILPDAHYFQGYKFHTRHLNRFDFFSPDYDCVGTRAIENGELYAQSNTTDRGTFGFTPNYSEYKVGHSTLSGDFRNKIVNGSGAMDCFHLFRTFDSLPVLSREFRRVGTAERIKLDRIFDVSDIGYEHFYCFFEFNITAVRPMASISESALLDIEHGEKTVNIKPVGHNVINN